MQKSNESVRLRSYAEGGGSWPFGIQIIFLVTVLVCFQRPASGAPSIGGKQFDEDTGFRIYHQF